jgi:predicted nucleic acid-binding Zn ribbon protein
VPADPRTRAPRHGGDPAEPSAAGRTEITGAAPVEGTAASAAGGTGAGSTRGGARDRGAGAGTGGAGGTGAGSARGGARSAGAGAATSDTNGTDAGGGGRAGTGLASDDAGGKGPASGGAGGTGPAGDGTGGGDPPAGGGAGPELARAVLDAALARRKAAGPPRRRRGGDGAEPRLRGYSGPGPDPRDPQKFGAVLDRLMRQRGWEKPKAEATVFGAWEKVVGPDIARHSRPVKLDDGVLTVEAESTAWATQLRMLAASLIKNIAGEVGHNVVTRLNIHGPAAPSWQRGPRRVQGRGPRDTYG